MHRSTLIAAAIAATLCCPAAAFANGAIAIGTDYRSDGGWAINVGYGVEYSSDAGAENRAMNECTMAGRGTATSRAACKIVTNFRNKCFGVAIDTQTGNHGWSVRDDLQVAEDRAVENCVEYGGVRQRCKISYYGCDK